MALPGGGVTTAEDLARQARRHGRHPVPERLPEDDPGEGGRRPRLGQGDQRRLQPRARDALRQGRRHARRVLELRGRRPRSAASATRDPADGEARRADLQRADLRRPRARTLDEAGASRLRRFLQRHRAPGTGCCATNPAAGVDALLKADKGLDRGLQEAVVKATLPVFFPADDEKPWGWQEPVDWANYERWMRDERPAQAAAVRGAAADQRVPARARGWAASSRGLSMRYARGAGPRPRRVGREEPAHLGLVGDRASGCPVRRAARRA